MIFNLIELNFKLMVKLSCKGKRIEKEGVITIEKKSS